MSSALHEQSYLECWRWMSRQILVTALNPIIGYQKAAEIAKQAYQQGRPVIDVALEHTDLTRSQLEVLLDPEKLTAGGV